MKQQFRTIVISIATLGGLAVLTQAPAREPAFDDSHIIAFDVRNAGTTSVPQCEPHCGPQPPANNDQGSSQLRLSTETFQDGGLVPDIMASNSASVGAQTCTLDGLPGGDQSPQLSWRNVPPGTRTFTIVMYDETGGFTHWAVYNIPRDVSSLPAGIAPDDTIGTQAYNDFFTLGYGGPCPPVGVAPTTHRYTITVYALADQLDVVNLADFPAYGESVYQALIKAARRGTIVQSATLTVFDSTTPQSN